jgi:hypothetical protein
VGNFSFLPDGSARSTALISEALGKLQAAEALPSF